MPIVPNSEVTSPLIYLPPQVAQDVSTAIYIHIGATTVLIWDIANNIRNDWMILTQYKIGLHTCAYFLSKITLLAYALGRTVLMIAPIENCAKFETVLNGILVVCVCVSTLMFYLRVYAIYCSNRLIKVIFGLTWLVVVGMSVTFTQTFTAEHLGPTNYCIEGVKNKFLEPTAIVLLVNDTFIYAAITYRIYILFLDSDTSTQQRMKLIVFGTSLPLFTKAILQKSQLYFLVIVVTKAFLVYTIRSLRPPTSVMYIICHLVLVNILSGRIFRTIKTNYQADGSERALSPEAEPGTLYFASNSSLGIEKTRLDNSSSTRSVDMEKTEEGDGGRSDTTLA